MQAPFLATNFAHLKGQAQLVHHVSEQAFAMARAKLSTMAIPTLNDWLVARADADGFVPRWHGRRLVAADASTLRFGRRASHVARAASADKIAFGLYRPGLIADIDLAAAAQGSPQKTQAQIAEKAKRKVRDLQDELAQRLVANNRC